MRPPADWSLIGRQPELDLIDRCRSRGDAGVVIAGPAGVGKSRLAREVLPRLTPADLRPLWIQASHSASVVTLGAFARLLPDTVRSQDPSELLGLAVREVHVAVAGSGSVLVIDDGHLLDAVSAALVLELSMADDVFIAMTIRSGEPCEDGVSSLWMSGAAERIVLEPLDAVQTDALAEEIAGGPIAASAHRWFRDMSQGNPLFVRELVHGAQSEGALREHRGLWQLNARPSLSETLRELITARLAGLSAQSTRALELLALGEVLHVSELLDSCGEATLMKIEARGLATVAIEFPEAKVSLSHPLYGEAIRAGLPAFRTQRRRLELAAMLERRARLDSAVMLRVTGWLIDAGKEVSTDRLLDAARVANDSGDPGLAERLARRAVDAGAGVAGELLLARAHVLRSAYLDAEAVLAAAEPGLTDRAMAVDYLDQRATVLYWGLRRLEDMHDLLDRARAWWSDPDWQHRIDTLGLLTIHRAESSVDLDASIRVHARRDLDDDRISRVAPAQALNLFLSGRVREAYALARSMRTGAVVELADQWRFGLWSRIALEAGLGWAELDAWNTAALTGAVSRRDHAAAGRGALVLASLRFLEGRHLQAGRLLLEAERHFEKRDAGGLLTLVHSLEVAIAVSNGDLEEVETALARCLAACGDRPLPAELPYVARARGLALRARGDLPRAQTLLLDAARELDAIPVYALRLSYEALRAQAPPGRIAASMQRLARRCDAPLPAAYAAHATARAEQDGDGLLQVSDKFVAIGALRYASEAAADAATSYLAAGRRAHGLRAAARSRELHARGEGGAAPLITGLEHHAIELTARERQIIDLARRGLTNAAIATQLVLSVRTVESHLYRAMHKLGVNSRHQLEPAVT